MAIQEIIPIIAHDVVDFREQFIFDAHDSARKVLGKREDFQAKGAIVSAAVLGFTDFNMSQGEVITIMQLGLKEFDQGEGMLTDYEHDVNNIFSVYSLAGIGRFPWEDFKKTTIQKISSRVRGEGNFSPKTSFIFAAFNGLLTIGLDPTDTKDLLMLGLADLGIPRD